MCIRDSIIVDPTVVNDQFPHLGTEALFIWWFSFFHNLIRCLLYTSDAADERSSVDLGGRRIIKKKTNTVSR